MASFDPNGNSLSSGDTEDGSFFGSDEDVIVQIHHESPPVLPMFVDDIDIPGLYDEFGEVSPSWCELFDDWISAMGHLLPMSNQHLDFSTAEEHSYSLSWTESNNKNLISNQNRAPVIVAPAPRRWEYECIHCNAKIQGGIRRLEAHVRNAHQIKCVCGEEFNSKSGLEYHIHVEQFARHSVFNTTIGPVIKHGLFRAKSNGRVPLECDFCEEIFTNRAVAMKHRKAFHAHLIGQNNNKEKKKTPLPRILKKRRDRKTEKRVNRVKKVFKIETVIKGEEEAVQDGIFFPSNRNGVPYCLRLWFILSGDPL